MGTKPTFSEEVLHSIRGVITAQVGGEERSDKS